MDNPIAGSERETIWEIMSEFFVDNEIDYDHWAGKISQYPLPVLRDIYFSEVAPVCGPNLLTPVPPVWQGFDTESVAGQIRENLSRRCHSLPFRLKYDTSVLFYRIACRMFWKPVEQAIMRLKAQA